MASDVIAGGKRRGRPPASDSAETRRRILDIALADEVRSTAGALYHYFGSKLDRYVAVNDDVWARIDGRLGEAVEGADGFVGKFEALLDTAHELNEEDPTLAAFAGSIRADMCLHPEIARGARPRDPSQQRPPRADGECRCVQRRDRPRASPVPCRIRADDPRRAD